MTQRTHLEIPITDRNYGQGLAALPYEVRFLTSDTVTPGVRASIAIDGGQVLQASVSADKGIEHIIDKVLIPPCVMP